MTHPFILTRPLLVHALAAVLLCPAVLAKPRTTPQKQMPPAKQTQPAKKSGPALLASAPAAKKATPAPLKKGARQTQGDAPAQPTRPDHRSLIVDPAALLARVPASGLLNEEQLILLAIARDPQLARRRAAIATAIADRRAVQDWKNPELRLSYGSQDDDFLRDPYTEHIIDNSTGVKETYSGTDTLTGLDAAGNTDPANMTVDTNSGTTTSTRYREIERLVTPRRDGGEDVTDTIISDSRTDTTTGTRLRQVTVDDFLTTRLNQAVGETITRGLEPGSAFHERTTGPGGGNGRESVSALLRFQMPHPWQKRARVQRASAEIMLAEAQYLAEEDKLVREVRDLYQLLGVLQSKISAHRKRHQNFTSLRAEMEGSGEPEFALDAFRARQEMTKVSRDIREVVSDVDRARAQLALRCGLRDTSRIRSGGIITRRVVDLATLDPGYLLEMAMLYRSDIVESRGRLEIARAYLAEAGAAKIPWATFIDAGWNRQWREGNSGTQDEWMVRLGIEIPLFEWIGINKRSKEYGKAAASWELQLGAQRDRISAEVDLALERLRKSAASLRDYENDILRDQREIRESLAKTEAAPAGLANYAKGKRFKYDAEDMAQQNEIGRYEAYDDYNKSLMALEDAIGVRVEKILNGWRDK